MRHLSDVWSANTSLEQDGFAAAQAGHVGRRYEVLRIPVRGSNRPRYFKLALLAGVRGNLEVAASRLDRARVNRVPR